MIGYITVGTNDLEKAGAFYDALLAEVGAKRTMEMGRLIAWGNNPKAPSFCICTPYDGNAATPGNGDMIALAADSPDTVHRMHAKALELGASDEGAPGPRGSTFYCGYFRDLDGNKLNIFCINKSE